VLDEFYIESQPAYGVAQGRLHEKVIAWEIGAFPGMFPGDCMRKKLVSR